MNRPSIIIVTGYSGAGKSSVLHTLEDMGFFCIDNLPLMLFDSFFHMIKDVQMKGQRIALGIDVRAGENICSIIAILHTLKKSFAGKVRIIFLTSDEKILLKRFQETRRRHPLATAIDLSGAIGRELIMLKPVLKTADVVLDTGQLTIHQLRVLIKNLFCAGISQEILVSVTSFGFKYGVPPESNFVYDVRSLPNPYFVAELRNLNGTDRVIIDYLFSKPEVQEYWSRFIDFVLYSIGKSHEEGRFFMNIAIGCTGGRHRSVAFAQTLAQESVSGARFLVSHRDVDKDETTRAVDKRCFNNTKGKCDEDI